MSLSGSSAGLSSLEKNKVQRVLLEFIRKLALVKDALESDPAFSGRIIGLSRHVAQANRSGDSQLKEDFLLGLKMCVYHLPEEINQLALIYDELEVIAREKDRIVTAASIQRLLPDVEDNIWSEISDEITAKFLVQLNEIVQAMTNFFLYNEDRLSDDLEKLKMKLPVLATLLGCFLSAPQFTNVNREELEETMRATASDAITQADHQSLKQLRQTELLLQEKIKSWKERLDAKRKNAVFDATALGAIENLNALQNKYDYVCMLEQALRDNRFSPEQRIGNVNELVSKGQDILDVNRDSDAMTFLKVLATICIIGWFEKGRRWIWNSDSQNLREETKTLTQNYAGKATLKVGTSVHGVFAPPSSPAGSRRASVANDAAASTDELKRDATGRPVPPRSQSNS